MKSIKLSLAAAVMALSTSAIASIGMVPTAKAYTIGADASQATSSLSTTMQIKKTKIVLSSVATDGLRAEIVPQSDTYFVSTLATNTKIDASGAATLRVEKASHLITNAEKVMTSTSGALSTLVVASNSNITLADADWIEGQ